MNIIKKLVLLCLAVAPLGTPAVARPLTLTIVEATMDRALFTRIRDNAAWNAAISTLKEDGDYVNLTEGKVCRIAGQEKAVEVTATVSTRLKGRTPDCGKLVYQENPNGTISVFFADPRKTPKDNPTNANAKSLFCGPWSQWAVDPTRTGCDHNFFCVSKNQKAYYITYVRTKQCHNSVRTDYKKVKQYCGCP